MSISFTRNSSYINGTRPGMALKSFACKCPSGFYYRCFQHNLLLLLTFLIHWTFHNYSTRSFFPRFLYNFRCEQVFSECLSRPHLCILALSSFGKHRFNFYFQINLKYIKTLDSVEFWLRANEIPLPRTSDFICYRVF